MQTRVRLSQPKFEAMLMVWDENHSTDLESEVRNVREVSSMVTEFEHDNSPEMQNFLQSF